jgi:uncharacterized protein YtpQ (UPF0354 family)
MTNERSKILFDNMFDWISQQEEGEMLITVLHSIGFTDEEIEKTKYDIFVKEYMEFQNK